jgi:AcrR family transcriptional regulator
MTPKYHRLSAEQRRDQILDAANDLFADRGYEEVSIEDIARSADVTRGLVHHYFGGRKDVYIALLERLGAIREEQLRPPVGRSARARVADTVSRWLDWTEENRTIYLGTVAPGEDIADPDVRRRVGDLRHRAVALLAGFHSDIAADSPRLRYALECWTGLNRAATRHWLRGDANRETTQEVLASTLEHLLRTFGAPATANRHTSTTADSTATRQAVNE